MQNTASTETQNNLRPFKFEVGQRVVYRLLGSPRAEVLVVASRSRGFHGDGLYYSLRELPGASLVNVASTSEDSLTAEGERNLALEVKAAEMRYDGARGTFNALGKWSEQKGKYAREHWQRAKGKAEGAWVELVNIREEAAKAAKAAATEPAPAVVEVPAPVVAAPISAPAPAPAAPAAPAVEPEAGPLPAPVRVVLVGCGKSKLEHAAEARDLYTGALFKARRAHAEATGNLWFVVSALHGLLEPTAVVEPYDARLKSSYGLPQFWGAGVLEQLRNALAARGLDLGAVELEVHAGRDYAEGIRDAGARVTKAPRFGRFVWPVKGLGVGQQLAFYARRSGEHFDPAPVRLAPALRPPCSSVADLRATVPPRLACRRAAAVRRAATAADLRALALAELAAMGKSERLLAARLSVQRFAWRCEEVLEALEPAPVADAAPAPISAPVKISENSACAPCSVTLQVEPSCKTPRSHRNNSSNLNAPAPPRPMKWAQPALSLGFSSRRAAKPLPAGNARAPLFAAATRARSPPLPARSSRKPSGIRRVGGSPVSPAMPRPSPPKRLDNSTPQHLDKMNILANSYFSGAGLMDLGLSRGGVTVQQSFELDSTACATLRANFSHEVSECDITQKTVEAEKPCDVMVATYPCTKYSTIADIHGTRSGDDLFLHFFRHLAIRRPEAYVVENVPGMRKFPVVMEAMTRLPDYFVNVFCPVDSSTWLPQKRARLIILGTRRPFAWRKPEAGRRVTLAEILEENPQLEIPAYVARRLSGKYRDKPIVSDPARGDLAPTCVAHYAKDVSTRLVADDRFPGGARPYTMREYARLQGVPDDFTFAGTERDAFRQIGNGVSVPVGEWVGRELCRYFGKGGAN